MPDWIASALFVLAIIAAMGGTLTVLSLAVNRQDDAHYG